MHITWLGRAAVKIQTKKDDADVIVLIDPFKSEDGVFPRSAAADIVLLSNTEEETISLNGTPFVIDAPGEYEVKGVLITAIKSENSGLIFRLDVENVSLAHLGGAQRPPSATELQSLGSIDALFLPAGGEKLSIDEAVKTITIIEPRLMIPISTASDNSPNAKNVKDILRALGKEDISPEKKLILKKKDLATEDLKIVVLDKE